MENIKTPRERIYSAFFSVDLINELNAKEEKTQEELDTISRNVKHLKIVMQQEDFVSELTIEEKTVIESLIN